MVITVHPLIEKHDVAKLIEFFKVMNERAESLPEIEIKSKINMQEVKNLLEKR